MSESATTTKYILMLCPVCQEKLILQNQGELEYFICQRCKGLLASGEVISALADELESKVKAKDPQILEALDAKNIYTLQEKKLSCPFCDTQMMKFNYVYDSNVFADKCPNCSLIWLENGELELISKHLKLSPLSDTLGEALIKLDREHCEADVITVRDPRIIISKMPIVLSDSSFRYHFPTVTAIIIGLNLLAAVILAWTGIDQKQYLNWGASISNLSFLSLLSTQFIHVNVGHLLGNLLMLWIFGDNVEDALGHWLYLLFYLMTGTLSTLGFVLITQNPLPAVGASGAVSAIMGSYLLLYPKTKLRVLWINSIMHMKARTYLLFFLFQQLMGWLVFGASSPIAYLGHAIGFIIGLIFTKFMQDSNLLTKVDQKIIDCA